MKRIENFLWSRQLSDYYYWDAMTLESFHLSRNASLKLSNVDQMLLLFYRRRLDHRDCWITTLMLDSFIIKARTRRETSTARFRSANVDYIIHWPVIIPIANQIEGNSRFLKKIHRNDSRDSHIWSRDFNAYFAIFKQTVDIDTRSTLNRSRAPLVKRIVYSKYILLCLSAFLFLRGQNSSSIF